MSRPRIIRRGIGPVALGLLRVPLVGDLRDTLELRDHNDVAIDLATLSDLQYRLNPVGSTASPALTLAKTTTADRTFPGGGTGADGRITFVRTKAQLTSDTIAPLGGEFDLEVVSIPSAGQLVTEATGRVLFEPALT